MVILIDTNVLIDFIVSRDPWSKDANKIFELCASKQVDGYVSEHSITDAIYSTRKVYSIDDHRNIFKNLLKIVKVAEPTIDELTNAFDDDATDDLEDSIQMQCAIACGADYIITRDADFTSSRVPAMTAGEFLSGDLI